MLTKYPFVTAIWKLYKGGIVAIVILILLNTIMFLVRNEVTEPKLEELSSEQSRLQQYVRQRQLESLSHGLDSFAEQMATNIQLFNDLIPPQAEFSDFIGELFDYAQRAGLNIHQINYKFNFEKNNTSELLRYGLNFSIKGTYSQIKKFIYLLENAPRILLIEKISMRVNPSRNGDPNKVNLQIELATFFQGRTA